MQGRHWAAAAYVWAAIVALGLAYFVINIPVQRSDALANLFAVQEHSWMGTAGEGLVSGYMRPAMWLQIKLAFHLAGEHYTPVFRGIHAVQILVCALLFVGVLRVRDRAAAFAVPFGLALLFAGHTFDGTIREAHPINTYLTVVLACLAGFALGTGRPSRWRDLAAVVLLATMLFTVETGVLVLVVLTVMWLTGGRGVSGRAVALCGVVLGVYIGARLMLLSDATPALMERASGFGFGVLEPRDLEARFGSAPSLFYLYNVMSQVFTVLFSEPAGGVFTFTASVLAGEVRLANVIAVGTVLASTALIGWFIASRWLAWRNRDFAHEDRVVLVFVVVLLVNAVVSFPYTKDVIMSPAGAFYALAAAVALRARLIALADARWPATVAATMILMVLSSAVAIRLVGVHYRLREASFVTRNDWTELEGWARRNDIDLSSPPSRAELVERLRDDALNRRTPAPTFTERAAQPFLRYLY